MLPRLYKSRSRTSASSSISGYSLRRRLTNAVQTTVIDYITTTKTSIDTETTSVPTTITDYISTTSYITTTYSESYPVTTTIDRTLVTTIWVTDVRTTTSTLVTSVPTTLTETTSVPTTIYTTLVSTRVSSSFNSWSSSPEYLPGQQPFSIPVFSTAVHTLALGSYKGG